MNKIVTYIGLFESVAEGGYVVTFPDLPGCITEGDTLDEAKKMAKDAVELYIQSLRDDNKDLPLAKYKMKKELSNIKQIPFRVELSDIV